MVPGKFWYIALVGLLALSCTPPAAESPTAPSAKPAESKPAAPAAAPAASPVAAAPAAPAAPAASPAAAAKPVESPAAAKPQANVKISHAGSQIVRLPLYVAIQNGYFKDEGINLEVVDTRSGSDAMKMLAGKAVEFSTGQVLDAVNLNKEGINIQGVAMMTSKFTNSIVVRKATADQIKSVKDLKGRSVGVTSVGSGTWQFAVFAAQQEGLQKEDLNFIAVGTGAEAIGAVKAGRVDALSFGDPENPKLVQDGDAVFLIDMADEATHRKLIGESYVNNQIMVSADYAKANPAVVQAFVNAIQRGLNWANTNTPEEVAKLLLGYKGFEGSDQALLLLAVKRQAGGVPRSGVITKDAFDNAMKLPVAVGVISAPMPYEQLVNTQFAEKAAQQYTQK